MAEMVSQQESRPDLRAPINWGAIWAGLFTFVAIWSVFGLLGFAIFTSRANPASIQAMQTPSIGLGIWAIVLTAVAMYVAGRVTGRLAGLAGRYESVAHGVVMFGLSIAAIALTVAGRRLFVAMPVTDLAAPAPYVRGLFGGSEWMAFIALFLGWIAAIVGASTGGRRTPVIPSNVRDMRPAA